MSPVKLVSSGTVAPSSDMVRNSNGNVGRKQESRLLGVVQQAFRVYLDRLITVFEGQEGGTIGLAIEGEERMDRR